MHFTIDLPEDIGEALRGRWGDVSRHALETLAVEAYRTGGLSENQVDDLPPNGAGKPDTVHNRFTNVIRRESTDRKEGEHRQ